MEFDELVELYIYNDSDELKRIIKNKITSGQISEKVVKDYESLEPEEIIKNKIRKDSSLVILNKISELSNRMDNDLENRERIREVVDFIFTEFKKSIIEEQEEEKNKVISALPRKK